MTRGLRSVRGIGTAAALLLLAGLTGNVSAQIGSTPPDTVLRTTTSFAPLTPNGDNIQQAGCSSCSSGLLGLPAPNHDGDVGCSSCGGGCASGGCNGHKPCDCCCDSDCFLGRFVCGFYQCVCCPDPCYDPHWNAVADNAFFQDGARPITQMQLTYLNVWDYPFPDKAEYLFAHSKGPMLIPGATGTSVSYKELMLYQEVALDRFSASIEMPYLQVSPDSYPGASGMGDLTIGTKSMLLDCELMQFTFGFKTIVPTGNFLKGLGTGHVSLEPALMMALKLAPETYLQSELAYRFPLGGDGDFEGPVLHYHLALNQTLWHCGQNIKVIGTLELNGYEILGGAYTDPESGTPVTLSAKSIGSIVNMGPGVRVVFCDKIDFGVGSAFNFTADSMGAEELVVQFRWRF